MMSAPGIRDRLRQVIAEHTAGPVVVDAAYDAFDTDDMLKSPTRQVGMDVRVK